MQETYEEAVRAHARNVARKYFGAPSLNEMKQALKESPNLPFPMFGYSGGYGPQRGALRDAIQRDDHATAIALYYELITQSILEGMEVVAEEVSIDENNPEVVDETGFRMHETINNWGLMKEDSFK